MLKFLSKIPFLYRWAKGFDRIENIIFGKKVNSKWIDYFYLF